MPSTQAPYDPQTVMAIAIMDHRAGRLVEAQRGYRAVLHLRPDDADALHQLGRTEVELGQIDAALQTFRRAVDSAPKNPDFHFSLATALYHAGRIADAADMCRRALALKPNHFEAFAGLVDLFAVRARQEQTEHVLAPRAQTLFDGGAAPLISVIVCSIDDAKRRGIRAHYENLLADAPHEIIQINDAKSLCEGYNRGFAQSSGDILVFSHDDIEITCADFANRLTRHFLTNDVIGIAGTSMLDDAMWFTSGWPHIHGLVVHRLREPPHFRFECFAPTTKDTRLQAIDGVFMAASRRVCQAVAFDEATFDGFHFYDLDFSYRAFRAGFKVAIAQDILIIHDSMGVNDAEWARYAQRFVKKFQDVANFCQRPRDLRLGLANFAKKEEVLELHRLLLPVLNELARA